MPASPWRAERWASSHNGTEILPCPGRVLVRPFNSHPGDGERSEAFPEEAGGWGGRGAVQAKLLLGTTSSVARRRNVGELTAKIAVVHYGTNIGDRALILRSGELADCEIQLIGQELEHRDQQRNGANGLGRGGVKVVVLFTYQNNCEHIDTEHFLLFSAIFFSSAPDGRPWLAGEVRFKPHQPLPVTAARPFTTFMVF